jgi:hypothetical protein
MTTARTTPTTSTRYNHLLLSLSDQLELLRRYNTHYWDNYLTDEQLAGFHTASVHPQQVDDLEILHVAFPSPQQDVEMWWRVLAGEQANSWRWSGFKTDARHLRRLDHSVREYAPGIHRVRINLVAHYEPERGHFVGIVRAQAKSSGEILAHAEVLSAYGLHPELLREQDGRDLPYANVAGFQVTAYGGSKWGDYPLIKWGGFSHVVEMDAMFDFHHHCKWATPVVVS